MIEVTLGQYLTTDLSPDNVETTYTSADDEVYDVLEITGPQIFHLEVGEVRQFILTIRSRATGEVLNVEEDTGAFLRIPGDGGIQPRPLGRD